MIFNRKFIKNISNTNKNIQTNIFRITLRKFSDMKFNINQEFLKGLISRDIYTQKINYEINLHDLKDQKLKLKIHKNFMLDNSINSEKLKNLYDYSFIKAENKVSFTYKKANIEDHISTDEIEMNFNMDSNFTFNISKSANIIIESDLIIKNKLQADNSTAPNIKLNCNESKVLFKNDFVFSNVKINAINSNLISDGFYSYTRKPKNDFELYEESLAKNKSLSNREEEADTEERIIDLTLDNSYLKIESIKHYNKLNIKTNNSHMMSKSLDNTQIIEIEPKHSLKGFISQNINNINIKYADIRNFYIELKEGDKMMINFYHIYENSIFKMRNINFADIDMKFHPFLLFNLNIYDAFKAKFVKFLTFDNEGYSFCPTILFDIDKEIPKNYVVGSGLVQIPKLLKWFLIYLISMLFIKAIFLSDNSLDNCYYYEDSFNTLNNLPQEISDYKIYQIAVKKKLNKLLEDPQVDNNQ